MHDIVIEDIEELESLLSRVYWIEEEFEQMSLWDAFASVDEKYRDILFKLAHDSEKHKIMLKKLIDNVEGLDLDRLKESIKGRQSLKIKRRLIDEEILSDIARHDTLALDIYTKIHDCTSRELIEGAWKGDDPDDFYHTFSELIGHEKRHLEILKPYVGKLQRIR